MPFKNPVLAGNFLARPTEQSPDYSPGVSGWALFRDGSAEFNNGTFRGSIEVGPLTGAHFIVNNPATGDVIDVYDASNRLIAYVNASGVLAAVDPSTGHLVRMTMGELQLSDGGSNDAALILLPAAGVGGQSETDIVTSPPVGANYLLRILGGSDDGTKGPTMIGNERDRTGSFVQSDQTSTNNLDHCQAVSGTTDASGLLTFNHGANFKDATGAASAPTMIFTQAHGTAASTFGTAKLVDGTITTTQAQVLCTNRNGTTAANTAVTFWIQCRG